MIDSTLKNANILVVDDMPSNIQILEGLLEESGYYNFMSTTDPRQVLGLFQTFQPDLILLDLMMPYFDGFEIMEQIAAVSPPNTYLPILVLTADITDNSKKRALSGGAKDFLTKPFKLYEANLRIKNLLETRYLHQQLEDQNQNLAEKVKERTYDLEMAYQQLESANKELKVLDKAKLDFLKMISHEIRTPLNGIKGFTEILKASIQSPELQEYLQYLEISATRLENFSLKALFITELHTHTYPLHMEEVSIATLIGATKISLQNKIGQKGINVELQNEPNIDIIHGDRTLLQICFESLIENAIKYSPTNGTVILKVYSSYQTTVCEIIDNGSGFTAAALDHLYDLFGLADQHIDQNTGMNLFMNKLIMDIHQGQILAKNNQEGGVTVRLTFTA